MTKSTTLWDHGCPEVRRRWSRPEENQNKMLYCISKKKLLSKLFPPDSLPLPESRNQWNTCNALLTLPYGEESVLLCWDFTIYKQLISICLKYKQTTKNPNKTWKHRLGWVFKTACAHFKARSHSNCIRNTILVPLDEYVWHCCLNTSMPWALG